jgi:SAM-dependent methyltransferase
MECVASLIGGGEYDRSARQPMDLLQQPRRAEKGVVEVRTGWKARLNRWRKRSPFNPYWLELRWLHRATAGLAPHARGELLDIGCGERPYEALFAPHVTRYVGIEYPPVADNLHPEIWGMIELIRGVVDVWGDGQRMPFKTGAFDTVLALEMLEHVADPDAVVAEIARVLRRGGRLLLTVPLIAPLHQWPFDYYRYTPRGIEAVLARHGFEIAHLEPRGNFASATGATVSHWMLRALGSRRLNHDGSVSLSRWRAPLVLPAIAAVQLFFAACERWSSDKGAALGYAVVAKLRD